MTKSQCQLNLGLILVSGIIVTIIYNSLSPEPDYIRFSFTSFLGILFVSITPASIILLIGTIIQSIKKSEKAINNSDTGSANGTYSHPFYDEESKKEYEKKKNPENEFDITLPTSERMEEWQKRKSLVKSDTKAEPGWKTFFIIAWIVFTLSNFFMLYGHLLSLNSK